MQIIPLRLVFAVAIEHLDAVVFTIGDIDKTVGVGCDVVDDIELAGIAARLAPGFYQPAVGRIFVHASVAITVRDINLALRRQRGVGAAVEWFAAHERRRLVRDADGQQHLAVNSAFAHGMVAIVGAIEIVVRIDVQSMRPGEQAFAPAPDKIAFAVEHHHRMGTAVEHVDAVLAVDRDRSNVREIPPLRQFCPVLHHAVAMLGGAENDRHAFSPRCGARLVRRRARQVSQRPGRSTRGFCAWRMSADRCREGADDLRSSMAELSGVDRQCARQLYRL